jgi:adenylate kinase
MEKLRNSSPQKVIHIDMGQLLRNMVSEGSYSGKLTAEIIEVGKRMPDFMPIYLTTNALVKSMTGAEHIVADGLARGPDQTRAWDDAMQFYGRPDYRVIVLELSEEESVKRLMARGRNDDTEEAIKSRLAWHKTDVEPQLEILSSRGRTIHRIDGANSIDVVHAEIMAALKLS